MAFDKCGMTCIHHYSNIQNSFAALKNPLCYICSSLPLLKVLATIDLFTASMVLCLTVVLSSSVVICPTCSVPFEMTMRHLEALLNRQLGM